MASIENQIEIRRKGNFTVIQNDLIWDTNLRMPARLALIAMLSLPPDWDFSIRGMAEKLDISKDAMSRIIAELEKAGYLKRKPQPHGAGGKFSKAGYILTDVAFDFGEDEQNEPCPDFPDAVEPCPDSPYTVGPYTVGPYTENSPQQNTKQVNTKQVNIKQEDKKENKKAVSHRSPEWKSDRFAGFWSFYPRGENKQGAMRAWDKLKPDDALICTMGQALKRQMASPEWQAGIGIPYASTWLNQRRWEDELRETIPRSEPDSGGWADDPEVY